MTLDKKLQDFVYAIAEALKENIIIEASKYTTVFTGTLANSDLVKDIKVSVDKYNITVSYPDYLKYVQTGRKKGSGKGSNIPIGILLKWMKAKGIARGKENQVAFAIQRNIFKYGIKNDVKPRPFYNDAIVDTINSVDDYFEKND